MSIDMKEFEKAKKGGKASLDYAKVKAWVKEDFLNKGKAPSEASLKQKFNVKLRTLIRHAKDNDDKVRFRTIKGQKYFVIKSAKQ